MSGPWMKWYPSDWRADPKLRMCSLAARGLWADILSLMHEAEPYGHLLVGNCAPTDRQLASLVGATPREVASCMAELESSGVFSRTEDGTAYSRRMVRDKAKAEQDRANGKRGGNPKISQTDNGGVNPPDKAQKLEARSHMPEEEASASSDARDDFDVWYSEFPNKVGKAHALKAFKAARKKADLETLLTGLRRYVANKPPDRQWCNPATWLNGERWLDQEAAPEANQAAVEDEVDRMFLEAAREADRRNDQQQRTDHDAVEPLELGFRATNGEDHQRAAEPEVRRTGGGLRGIATALPALGTGGRH